METIEVENTYNKDGVWIKSTANGVPLFIPEQTSPSIQILDIDIQNYK
jgi:hypothetical protein